jgi:hypothetical protein
MSKDPLKEGKLAALDNVPAGANPYPSGTNEHALWKNGYDVQAAAKEAGESENSPWRA